MLLVLKQQLRALRFEPPPLVVLRDHILVVVARVVDLELPDAVKEGQLAEKLQHLSIAPCLLGSLLFSLILQVRVR